MRTEKPKSNSFIIRYSVCLFSSGWTLSSFCNRGGSRGRVQGVRTPPPLNDLWFSNTTGILQKKNYVVYWCWSRARDECTPSWKKSWNRPCVISARWEDKSWCPLYSNIKLVTPSSLLPFWDVWYVWTHNMRRAKTKPWKKCPSLFCNISVDPFCCLEKKQTKQGERRPGLWLNATSQDRQHWD